MERPQSGRVLVGAEGELGTPAIQFQGVSVSPQGGLQHPPSPPPAVFYMEKSPAEVMGVRRDQ